LKQKKIYRDKEKKEAGKLKGIGREKEKHFKCSPNSRRPEQILTTKRKEG